MSTRTLFVQLDKLAQIEGAELVAIVALVCNDIAIANPGLGHYMEVRSSPRNDYIGRGGALYFARLITGHLREGLKAVGEIQQAPRLMGVVGRCCNDAREAFDGLCACLPGGSQEAEFKKYVTPIRNKIAFHYDKGELKWALDDRASRSESARSTMTGGDNIRTTRFEFADDLIDSLVCRKLWGIPRTADLRGEADRISDWCHTRSMEFLRFGQDFVPRFFREYGITV